MDLCKCRILLNNNEVVMYHSVEQSLGFIESQIDEHITAIEIDATDGLHIHRYRSHDIEESIENLMNL
ncbi:hypothetical protein BCU68_16010 [Vibrio sp. 10N.286.49.B3]|nr:hypothetical protein BCU68_16010 [Vibrio sp. 10N.286.49.B3]